MIKPVNGKYRLTLSGAKCDDPHFGCRVGGRPIILVENTPAKSLAAPIVASTATPQPKSK